MSPGFDPGGPDSDLSAATNLAKSADSAGDSSNSQPIDARGAMGVQFGEGNTQVIYTYNRLADRS